MYFTQTLWQQIYRQTAQYMSYFAIKLNKTDKKIKKSYFTSKQVEII